MASTSMVCSSLRSKEYIVPPCHACPVMAAGLRLGRRGKPAPPSRGRTPVARRRTHALAQRAGIHQVNVSALKQKLGMRSRLLQCEQHVVALHGSEKFE